MSTSGETNIVITQESIIKGAFRLLGMIESGKTIDLDNYNNAAEALNLMLSEWQAEGIGLWKEKDVTLFLTKERASYPIGASGTIPVALTDDCALTTLSAEALAGETSITVVSASGISKDDYIGIELAGGTMNWTTANGAPVGTTINLDNALTGDAESGAMVAAFTTKALRPLEVIDARVIHPDGNSTPLNILSKQEYNSIAIKTSAGVPNSVFYDPQRTDGILYVWPTAQNSTYRVAFTGRMPIEIFSERTDNPDLTQEWFNTLRFNLAELIGLEYPKAVKVSQYKLVSDKAQQLKRKLQRFDSEHVSIQFIPDTTGY